MASASPTKSAAAILVVDDDEVMRDLLQRMLQRSGFAVVTAVDGRDGIDRFRECPVQLAITDMKMPVMDGLELMRALLSEQPDVNIIAVSGVDEWDTYFKIARSLGAKALLRKPVSTAELVETVQRLLPAKTADEEEV